MLVITMSGCFSLFLRSLFVQFEEGLLSDFGRDRFFENTWEWHR